MELSEARELAEDMCRAKGCNGWSGCYFNNIFLECEGYNKEVKEIMEDENNLEQEVKDGK